jgi:predicted  nucleic acid-binding Zn-ribbon protein
MHNCRCVVFISSENSRRLECDALKIELPYIRDNESDMGRIEYILDEYDETTTRAAKRLLEDIFSGLEYCRTKEDLVDRILNYVTGLRGDSKQVKVKYCLSCGAENSDKTKFCSECGNNSFVNTFEEYRRDAQKKIDEQKKLIQEEERRQEEENKAREQAKARQTEAQKATQPKPATNKPATNNKADIEGLWHFNGQQVTLKNYDKNEFTISGKTLVIYKGRKSRVIIPIGVTCIGAGAFENCLTISEILVPDTVTTIYNSAFMNCGNLREISLPQSVRSIGYNCFAGCVNLMRLDIPDSVNSINKSTFFGCSGLKEVNLGSNIRFIDEFAFGNCHNLVQLTIKEGIVNIAKRAFLNCSDLMYINIPLSVQTIAANAFYGCRKLTIYCRVLAKPQAWHKNWNVCTLLQNRCKVEWGKVKR